MRLSFRHARKRRVIREIEPKRRKRHESLAHRPLIRALFDLVQWPNGDPEHLVPHRILRRNDPPVVMADGLPCPAQVGRLLREVHVHEVERLGAGELVDGEEGLAEGEGVPREILRCKRRRGNGRLCAAAGRTETG